MVTVGYPTFVGVITLVFAILVLLQYVQRGRPYQLAWTLSLLVSAVASFAYALMPAVNDPAFLFRLYYLGGALLTAPLMGLGSIYLLSRPTLSRISTGFVVALSLLGAVYLFTSDVDVAAVRTLEGGPGTGIIAPGPWRPILILLNIFGSLAVVGIAVSSAMQFVRRKTNSRFVAGNILIATGITAVAGAGSLARIGIPAGFWIGMALGWAVAFAGFLVISPPAVARSR